MVDQLTCMYDVGVIMSVLKREGFDGKSRLKIIFEDSIQNQFSKSFLFDMNRWNQILESHLENL
jgi:hypothetical protein